MQVCVNDITLSYDKTGSGEPLILLHGNGEDHHIFDTISVKLRNNFTLYAIDSRNHGLSDKTDDFSYETMSEDIFSFIRTLDLGKVNMVGFSDGAIIALLLALNHSECISKMALLGVNLKPDDFTEDSYQYIKEAYEKTHDPLFRLMLEQPNIELDSLKGINTPTLIVGAENDIFKPATFLNISKAIKNSQLKIMPGHDHDSYITNQDLLYPDLIDFFK